MPMQVFGPQLHGYQTTPMVSPVDLAQAGQYGQQIQGQNALRQVFADPGSIDPSGQINPNALRQVLAADPNTGLNIMQYGQQQQQRAAQIANYNAITEMHRKQIQKIDQETARERFGPLYDISEEQNKIYERVKRQGGSDEDALTQSRMGGATFADPIIKSGVLGDSRDHVMDAVRSWTPDDHVGMKMAKSHIAKQTAEEQAVDVYINDKGNRLLQTKDGNFHFFDTSLGKYADEPYQGTMIGFHSIKQPSLERQEQLITDREAARARLEDQRERNREKLLDEKEKIRKASPEYKRDKLEADFNAEFHSRFPLGGEDVDYFEERDRFYRDRGVEPPPHKPTETEKVKSALKKLGKKYDPKKGYRFAPDGSLQIDE